MMRRETIDQKGRNIEGGRTRISKVLLVLQVQRAEAEGASRERHKRSAEQYNRAHSNKVRARLELGQEAEASSRNWMSEGRRSKHSQRVNKTGGDMGSAQSARGDTATQEATGERWLPHGLQDAWNMIGFQI